MGNESKKRKTRDSPCKEGPSSSLVVKIGERATSYSKELEAHLLEVEQAKSVKDLKDSVVKSLKASIGYHKDMASHVSDLCAAVVVLEARAEAVNEKADTAKERVAELEKARETIEVKASRRDMAAKIEHATTQVKVMDLDFDREIDNQKDMVNCAKTRLTAKVKAEDQPKFTELVKKAGVQVLARKTTKRKAKFSNEEIWTAPVVMTIPERSARWEMEDLLRRNKIFPTFHWPKDFLDPLKKMKEELKKKVDEDTHFVRIRPTFSDSKWKIRADTRPKEGNAKFAHAASWEMPPADEAIRNKVKNWFVPSWADVVSGRARLASQAAGAADGSVSESDEEMDP